MRTEHEDEFRRFAVAGAVPLRRFAYLLCADWHLAEDLVQSALVKIHRSWPRLLRRNAVDAYARQAVLRCWLDERTRPWRRAERRDGVVPDHGSTADGSGSDDPEAAGQRLWQRDAMLRALTEVPPRQRAVLVLRYWEDRSVAETAAVLRCSEGTVKSQAARGLQTLRRALEPIDQGSAS